MTVLVDMPEIAWIGPWSTEARFHVGEELEVILLTSVLEETGYAYGSFKRLHPDANIVGQVSTGTVLEGRVSSKSEEVISISVRRIYPLIFP